MGLLDNFYRVAEPAAGLLSGATAEPVAGWYGLLGGGAQGINKLREAMTYQPRTEAGREGQNALAQALMAGKNALVDNNPPVRMAVDGFNALADRAGAVNPLFGAAVKTIPAAAGLLAGPGSQVSRNALANVAMDTGRFVAPKFGEMAEQYMLNTGGLLGVVKGDGRLARAMNDKYPGPEVDAYIMEGRGPAVLSKIVVDKEARNQGVGSAFMRDLAALADDEGKTLALTPSSDFGGSKARLEDFYKRFGFVPNKGKSKDFEISEGMYRAPQQSAADAAISAILAKSARGEKLSIAERVALQNSQSTALGKLDDAIRPVQPPPAPNR